MVLAGLKNTFEQSGQQSEATGNQKNICCPRCPPSLSPSKGGAQSCTRGSQLFQGRGWLRAKPDRTLRFGKFWYDHGPGRTAVHCGQRGLMLVEPTFSCAQNLNRSLVGLLRSPWPCRSYYKQYYNCDFYSMESRDENSTSWKSLYCRAASCRCAARFPLAALKDEQRQVPRNRARRLFIHKRFAQ